MGLGTEARVPVGGSTVVGCAPVSCVPVHTPVSSGGRCCTHARMDMCATGMCSCKHVWSMCVHACEHAQACTVQCIVATRVRVCTCQCIRAVVSVCVCVQHSGLAWLYACPGKLLDVSIGNSRKCGAGR